MSMSRVRDRRTRPLRHALSVLGLAVAFLLCAPLSSLAIALETRTCQGVAELPSLCAKAFGSKEFSLGLVLEPGSPGLGDLVPDGLTPVAAWTPDTPRPAPAWSVRAPPSIN